MEVRVSAAVPVACRAAEASAGRLAAKEKRSAESDSADLLRVMERSIMGR